MGKEIIEKMEDLQDKEIADVVAKKAEEDEGGLNSEEEKESNSSKYFFYIIGGGYLLYMSYKLIADFSDAGARGAKLSLLVGAIVLFVLAGALFIYIGIRNIWGNKK